MGEDAELLLEYVPVWPLVLQISTGFFCMGCSAFYHLFYVKNEFFRNLLYRLDFGGIIILIMGSAMPPHYYPFACKETHFERNVFMSIIVSMSLLCFIVIMAPTFQDTKWRPLVTTLFIILGLSAALPIYYLCIFVTDSMSYTK